jgi:uncharacterized membrane protein
MNTLNIRPSKSMAKIGAALMDVSMFVVGFSLAGHEDVITWVALLTGAIGRVLTKIYGTSD